MLNELKDLSRSLKEAKISQKDWHSKFKKCPKYKAFLVYPAANGEIDEIEPIGDAIKLDEIRKWEKNQGWSFPVFNIPPIYSATEDDAKKKFAKIQKKAKRNETVSWTEINETIGGCNSLWDENTKTKVENSLHRAADEVKNMLGVMPDEFRAISALIERAKKIDYVALHDAISKLAIKGLYEGKAEFIDILFKGPNSIQLILELKNWAQIGYQYPAIHREVQKWMNKMFLAHDQKNLENVPSSTDAFGENAAGIDNQKFPEVRLPILGNVKIRSMFKDIPAQTRYGMIEAKSFPAGDKVRKEMKSALEWLSDQSRKGKTWCDLTKRTDKPSLLFAYPAAMPESPPELAGLLGGTDDNVTDPEGVRFSAIAKRVTGTLQGIARARPVVEVRIFVLAKMDKARTKVLVSKRYTADHTIKSAEEWQAGCRNIPNIKIRQFEDKTPVWKECLVPFPAEVPWCLNTAWRRQGTYAARVHGFSINDALCLLLDESNEAIRLSLRAIDAIVRNSASLMLAIGQENAFSRVFKINKKYEKQALLLPSILGLLLYKNGIEKGGFMNSPAYLVGRFLSLTDDLHLKYCQHVRKGSIPPQLVGNALMPTALEAPEKALSMLSQRILPYQGWAKTLSGDEKDVGLVKYFLKQIGEISNQIKEEGLPPTCSDADKAQMLLGYLARSENN